MSVIQNRDASTSLQSEAVASGRRFRKIRSHSGTVHYSLGYGLAPYHAKRFTTLCEFGIKPGDPEPDEPVNCPYCLQIMRAIEGVPYDPAFKWKPDQMVLQRCNTAAAKTSTTGAA